MWLWREIWWNRKTRCLGLNYWLVDRKRPKWNDDCQETSVIRSTVKSADNNFPSPTPTATSSFSCVIDIQTELNFLTTSTRLHSTVSEPRTQLSLNPALKTLGCKWMLSFQRCRFPQSNFIFLLFLRLHSLFGPKRSSSQALFPSLNLSYFRGRFRCLEAKQRNERRKRRKKTFYG